MSEVLDFIDKYYLIVWIITGVLILALIGYLVDSKRKKDFIIDKKNEKQKENIEEL